MKVLKSSILSESRDYGSVALKCLTPRFALFPFSLLFTLGEKKLVVLVRPQPWVCLENRRMKNGCYYIFILKTSMFSEFLSPPQPHLICCNSPPTLMKSIFSKGWKHSSKRVIELE